MDKMFTLPEAFVGQPVVVNEDFKTVIGTFNCMPGITKENEEEKDYEYQIRLGLKLLDVAEKSESHTVTGDMIAAIEQGVITPTDLLYMATRGWKQAQMGAVGVRMKGRMEHLEDEELIQSVIEMLMEEKKKEESR